MYGKSIIIATIVTLAGSALSGEIERVPDLRQPEVAFRARPGPKSAQQYEAAGGDGARLVVSKAAVVSGTAGSVFQLPERRGGAEPSMTVVSGAFRIHVGTRAFAIALGRHTLIARQSTLLLSRSKEGWLIRAEQLPRGTVVLETPPPPEPVVSVTAEQPSTESNGSVVPQPTPKPAVHKFDQGQVIATREGQPIAINPAGAGPVLKKLVNRLRDPAQQGALLSPMDVEKLPQLAADHRGEGDPLENLEVEEIEVEVGCVEICVD